MFCCAKLPRARETDLSAIRLMSIQRQAGNCSYGGLEKILAAIEKTRRRFRANVNQEMSMELLLLTIKENIK